MSFQVWRRRRNVLLLVGAITAGGYVSFRVYTSQYMCRKRKQVSGFLKKFSRLSEAVTDGSDCAAILFGDFKKFLLSEEDEVPCSVKQVFKVLKCPEFQEGIMFLLHNALLGKIGGIRDCEKKTNFRTIPVTSSVNRAFVDEQVARNGKPVIQNGRQMNKTFDTDVVEGTTGDLEDENCPIQKSCFVEGLSFDQIVSDQNSYGYGQLHNDNESLKDGLLERFMDKLFSERGKSFASAVVGRAARNLVLSGFEVMNSGKRVENRRDSSSLTPDICEVQQGADEKLFVLHLKKCFKSNRASENYMSAHNLKTGSANLDSFLNFLSDRRGRSLIAECIENFVATAVSVYLDKTRDINVYEELVEGLTKPSHQAPVKELFRSVCSDAVETFVRTSHEVLFQGSSYSNNRSDLAKNEHEKRWEILSENSPRAPLELHSTSSEAECSPISHSSNVTSVNEMNDSNVSKINCLSEDVHNSESQKALESINPSTCRGSKSSENLDRRDSSLASFKASKILASGQCSSSNGGSPNLVDGLSKALAVPNNRKLVIDVAGAMTSEAVHSFFAVLCNICKPIYGGLSKSKEQDATSSLQAPCFHWGKSWYLTKNLALNSLVLVTLWLVVVMHVAARFKGT